MRKKSVRLSKDIVPKKYELHLTPDLDAFVFAGTETIHLELKKPTKTITLHSIELEIGSGRIPDEVRNFIAKKISYDEKSETATLIFGKSVAERLAQA